MGSEPTPDVLGLVGTTIAEKYAVEGVVGEGGFAVVYRANHVLWKRPVAVKVFKALGEVAKEDRQKLLDDFIQEGALLADLSERSTAICQARDVGMLTTPRGEAVPYMVLEWLEGRPLEALLAEERAKNAPLRTLEQTVHLLDPVAEALALAHKKGIAHRDIKPANVFVLGDAHGTHSGVKLLDFGIAKVVQDAQKMGFGKTAGHITSFTPSYGAPEQFNRAYGATGPWTDVFAFALMTAEVLSGCEPIGGDNLVQLAFASSDPNVRPTPRTLGVAVSDDVEAVFRKAVAVKPEDRYQSAGEFWNALRMVAVGHPLSTISSVRSDREGAGAGAGSGQGSNPNPAADTVVSSLNPSGATAVAPGGPAAVGGIGGGPVAHAATAMSPPMAAAPVSYPQPQSQPQFQTTKKSSIAPVIGGAVGLVVVIAGIVVGYTLHARSNKTGMLASSQTTTSMSAAPTASTSASAVPVTGTCPPGMKMIPGGEYFMGSDEKDAEPNEKPPHK